MVITGSLLIIRTMEKNWELQTIIPITLKKLILLKNIRIIDKANIKTVGNIIYLILAFSLSNRYLLRFKTKDVNSINPFLSK